MRIFAIKLGYIHNWDEKEKALVPEKIAARKAILDRLGIKHAHSDDALRTAPEFIVTDDMLLSLMVEGQNPEIVSEVGIGADQLHRTVERLDALLSRTAAMFEANSRESSFNEKVEVHVPGAALMTVNHTLLMEDAGSDELQAALDRGGRNIAASPRPNPRPPDYILGRYDPAHEVDGCGAVRKYGFQNMSRVTPI